MIRLRTMVLTWILVTWINSMAGATNHAPVILAGPTADPPRTLQYNPGVRMSAVAADPDGDPVTCTWDLGDGRRLHGASVEAWWNNKTTYTVTLTASDGKGGTISGGYHVFRKLSLRGPQT